MPSRRNCWICRSSRLPATDMTLWLAFYPGELRPPVRDDARWRSQAPGSLRSLGAVAAARRPIAGRLAALGKTGSLRSRNVHAGGAGRDYVLGFG